MFTSGPGTSYNNGRVVSNHFACSSQSKTSKKSGIKKTESEKVKRKFVRSSAFDFVNHAGFDGFDCGSNDRDRAECVRVFIGERGERSVRRTEYFENSEGESYLKVFPKDVLLLE